MVVLGEDIKFLIKHSICLIVGGVCCDICWRKIVKKRKECKKSKSGKWWSFIRRIRRMETLARKQMS